MHSVGDVMRWEPSYFKWDAPADVEVVRVYRNGHALLSNNKIADEDGCVWWYGRMAGRVHSAMPLTANTTSLRTSSRSFA